MLNAGVQINNQSRQENFVGHKFSGFCGALLSAKTSFRELHESMQFIPNLLPRILN